MYSGSPVKDKKESLRTADVSSSLCVQNGHLAKELDLVSHHVRTRLDELKRQEVSRLRMLFKAKLDSTNIQGEWAGPCVRAGEVTWMTMVSVCSSADGPRLPPEAV